MICQEDYDQEQLLTSFLVLLIHTDQHLDVAGWQGQDSGGGSCGHRGVAWGQQARRDDRVQWGGGKHTVSEDLIDFTQL